MDSPARCARAVPGVPAGCRLPGGEMVHGESSMAENNATKLILQQNCCPFLVRADFSVVVSAAFWQPIPFPL